VKSVAKRGKKLKPNEVERARKIEVILTKEQKELFQQWCEVFCFTYNRALELFQTETFRNKDIYTEKPSKKTGKYELISGWMKLKTYVLDPERLYDCDPYEQWILWQKHKEILSDLKVEACHEMYVRWFSTKESLAAKNKDVTAFKMNPKHLYPNQWRKTICKME